MKYLSYNTPALKKKLINRSIADYISGYIDGEGCFSVSFTKRQRFIVGWETKPSFSVSQNHDRAEVLYQIQSYFGGIGFMRRDMSDKTLKYEVRKLDDLLNKIIPHFERYSLISSKNKDFLLFQKICLLMKDNHHKNLVGLEKIVDIAFKMNSSGRRKYNKQDIINFAKDLQMKV